MKQALLKQGKKKMITWLNDNRTFKKGMIIELEKNGSYWEIEEIYENEPHRINYSWNVSVI